MPPPGWSVIMLKNLFGLPDQRESRGRLVAQYSAEFPPAVTTDHFATVRAGYWLANQDKPTQVIYRFLVDVRQSFDKRIYTRSIHRQSS